MPGFMPGIHVLLPLQLSEDVDARDKRGHDDVEVRCPWHDQDKAGHDDAQS
jgi:hypothetical protein